MYLITKFFKIQVQPINVSVEAEDIDEVVGSWIFSEIYLMLSGSVGTVGL